MNFMREKSMPSRGMRDEAFYANPHSKCVHANLEPPSTQITAGAKMHIP
jgi:hypothetical protein